MIFLLILMGSLYARHLKVKNQAQWVLILTYCVKHPCWISRRAMDADHNLVMQYWNLKIKTKLKSNDYWRKKDVHNREKNERIVPIKTFYGVCACNNMKISGFKRSFVILYHVCCTMLKLTHVCCIFKSRKMQFSYFKCFVGARVKKSSL